MIVELLRAARGLDKVIRQRLGPIYNAVLGIGLIFEIVRELREFGARSHGPILSVLALALFVLLLLHQLGELAQHAEQRFRGSR